MKIATWNVNSVRARAERLLRWLDAERPDVVCLQELKALEDDFPRQEVGSLGYQAAVLGQKAYNGVAILSRHDLSDVRTGMCDGGDDTQARLIAATVAGIRVVSVYVPNGFAVGTDKYAFKVDFLRRLSAFVLASGAPARPIAVCGDLNIFPDDRDCHDPAMWEGTVLYNPEMRAAFRALLDVGLEDVLRRHRQEAGLYTFWDYQMLAFPKNNGLRLDFVLATPPLASRSVGCTIHRNERKGSKPSDHVPVVAEFDWPVPTPQ